MKFGGWKWTEGGRTDRTTASVVPQMQTGGDAPAYLTTGLWML